MMRDHLADSATSSISSKLTYGGAGTAFFLGLTVNEFAVLASLLIALAGWITNWYYKRKADRRASDRDAWERQHLPSWRQRPTSQMPDDGN